MENKIDEIGAISINRKDVYWNYAATFLRVAAQANTRSG
jgi:hypothetical protein